MIEIKNLNKSFGRFKALKDVSVNFNRKECIALIGPNGSGKTTLIKNILGMAIPDSGDIVVNGESIRNNWEYRRFIGYMPQNAMFPEHMAVGQVLDMMRDIRKTETENDDLYREFQIEQILDKKMRALSGGMKQKVNATIAFMFSPKALILDEPTAGLDPIASEILKEKINAEKSNETLVLITSHILSDLDELVTGITYIQEGRVHFSKSIDQLKADTSASTLTKAIAQIMKQ